MNLSAKLNHTFVKRKSVTRILFALMLGSSSLSQANETESFNINLPAQPLSDTLKSLSQSSDTQLLYADNVVKDLKSKPLQGDYTLRQALSEVLADNGLTYEKVSDSLIAVKQAEVSAPKEMSQDGVQNLSPMTVTSESQKSYVVSDSNTATKTDTPLKETPMSIQVINRKIIDDQQNITMSESLHNVSGVVARNPLVSPNFEPTLMRGFSGMQMLDGFYQNLNTGDQGSLVNIQDINVLKGANATLYSGGAGSPVGGVVNMVSKLPEKEAFYEIGIKGGSYDFIQPYVDLNQPLSENILFRVTAEYTNNESHIDVLETERFNVNPTLTITDNEATSFTLQGKFSNWEQQDYQGLPATGTITGDFNIKPELYIGPDDIPDSESEFYGVWGTLEHQFNDIWSATLKGRYAHSIHDTFNQGIFGADGFAAEIPAAAPSTWVLSNVELFQEQDEVSFQAYATAKFDFAMTENTLLFGVDFTELEEKGFIDFDAAGIGFVDLNNPAFLPYDFPGARENNQFITNTTYGGYVQLQSTIAERVHLLAGVRLGYIETEFKNTDPFFGFEASSEVSRFLPNVGAVFDVTENFSLFANYSEGMRAQSGVNFVSTPKPELSYQMEAGIKFNIAEQLSGQLSAYQIDREDVAVTDFTDPQFRSVAKGKQRSHGIETNFAWQATDSLSFLATYAFSEAEFRDNLSGVATGNDLPGIPQHSGRFWANYAFQESMFKGLSLGAGIYAQSDSYLSNNNLYKVEGYYTIDASINYEIQNYKLGVSVKNLTDNDYFERLNYFGSRVTPAQGTAFFVQGSVRF